MSYGWVVAVAGAALLFLNAQFVYSFGVLVPPLIEQFGWSRATISSIATIRSLVTAGTSPVAGRICDRYGARTLILAGVILCGSGYVISWASSELWHLYIAFGLLMGVGNTLVAVPGITVVNRWFPVKSALANGIVFSGASFSAIIIPPLLTFFFLRYGWNSTVFGVGLATWIIGLVAWKLVRAPPRTETRLEGSGISLQTTPGDVGLRQVLGMRDFWLIFWVFFITAVAYNMMSTHIVIAAMDTGATAAAAALVITVTGIASTAGRLSAGMADRFGKKRLLVVAASVQAVSITLLAFASSSMELYVVMAVYGLGYGLIIPNVQSIAAGSFTRKAVGAVLGTMTFGNLIGAAIGPLIGGFVFDNTGSYQIAFLSAAGAAFLALALSVMFRAPGERCAKAQT